MSSGTPKISVVIPLYNHARYIEETVRSVLAQSYGGFELIIVNDGSSDDSEAVVGKIKDERIRYFSQDNQGAPRAINRGVHLARGEYVSILNSDDVYYPERLEECMRTLEANPLLAAVFSHLEFIDEEGNFVKYLRGAEENWQGHAPETSFKGANNMVLDLLAGNFLTTTSNLFCRKEIFTTTGFFGDLRYAHDYDFFLRLCSDHATHLIEKPLVKYRIHGLNTVKENEAVVNFEVGLVLARFFLEYGPAKILGTRSDISSDMTKFINSINPLNTDRMIMTMLFFGRGEEQDVLFRALEEDSGDSFRRACIERAATLIDTWKNAKEGWEKWQEANGKLIEKDKELQGAYKKMDDIWKNAQEGWAKWQETNERLIERDEAFARQADALLRKDEELREKDDALHTAGQHLEALQNSRSYRLGRALTWPLRKLRGRA